MNTSKSKQTASIIGNLLSDLTHLEINTIIKDGMTSAPPPTDPLELLWELLGRYKQKLSVIIHKTDEIDTTFDVDSCHSYEKLNLLLGTLTDYMDANTIRFEERYYILVLRMKSFCRYIGRISKTDEGLSIQKADGTTTAQTVYDVDLSEYAHYRASLGTDDLIKIKRFFDLGTEDIVMQTRFGIDGDVVSRVQREFANSPRQLVVDLHEKHTNLSLDYWKSLINLVNDLVQGIFTRRKQ